jgi:hypothetical protein
MKRVPVAGGEAWLRANGFPLDGRPAGNQRNKDSPQTAAIKFAGWLKAYGISGDFSKEEILALWSECARQDHREQAGWNHMAAIFNKGKPKLGIRSSNPRVDGQENVRPVRWTVAPGKPPKVGIAESPPEPEVEQKERGRLLPFLPLGVAPVLPRGRPEQPWEMGQLAVVRARMRMRRAA